VNFKAAFDNVKEKKDSKGKRDEKIKKLKEVRGDIQNEMRAK